jgi:hypothetical protein
VPTYEGEHVLKKSLAAAALLTLTACGVTEVDIDAVEENITSEVKDQLDADVTVDCPDQVDWETGESFTCDVAAEEGTTRQANVTMVDDDGNVRWELE